MYRNILVISGGQTGADQGGLCGARDAGVKTGGWAPDRFLTEKGPRPSLASFFGLKDSHVGYLGRTRLNAEWGHITLWFGLKNSAGSYATSNACKYAGKPFVTTAGKSPRDLAAVIVKAYDEKMNVEPAGPFVINVAGNRESKNPGIFESTRYSVKTMLGILMTDDTEQAVLKIDGESP